MIQFTIIFTVGIVILVYALIKNVDNQFAVSSFPSIDEVSSFVDIAMKASSKYNLDFYMVYAIIERESTWTADIIGSAGEMGLMQISSAVAQDYSNKFGVSPARLDLKNPEINVEIGCWYLHWLYQQLYDWEQVLRSYNCGMAQRNRAVCGRYAQAILERAKTLKRIAL